MDPSTEVVPNLVEKKEKGNSKMGKRESLTNIDSLPDEMIFNIFLFLSAQDIHDNARLVCRKWYHIIHNRTFMYAHFQHTTSGLLIQDTYNYERLIFVGMQQGRIEISKFNYDFGNEVWGSCNGLILEHEEIEKEHTLYIANPVTKQRFALPPFCHKKQLFLISYGIAYVAASMVYKVVVTYYMAEINSKIQCVILTVGVDNSWREVNTQHLSHEAELQLSILFHFTIPIVSEGFMLWSGNCTHFLTLNVETEIFTETFSPQVCGEITGQYCFSVGKCVSLLIGRSKLSYEVWEMKPETGEWMRLPDIDLEAQKCALERFGYKHKCKRNRKLVPVGWLKYKEVLVLGSFDALRNFIAYDVRREEIDSLELISGTDEVKEQTEVVMEDADKSLPTAQQEEEVVKKKYGGIMSKKPPLVSKDHERAYFDSADWALGKQGVAKPKGPLEALRPKLQPTQQQAWYHKSPYAPSEGEDGTTPPSEDASTNECEAAVDPLLWEFLQYYQPHSY